MPKKKTKILIIDNTAFLGQVLSSFLDKETFEIATEKGADIALLKLIHWHPDLIITSIEVGNINGFDLCLIVRMMPDFAGIPIILISSSDKRDEYHLAADAGADCYLKKDKKALLTLKKEIHSLLFKEEKQGRDVAKHPIKNILLVDDSATMRKIIKNILAGIGIKNCVEAEHGQDGLEKLDANDIDMVISDWNMPVMNGVEMIKQIRLNPEYSALPIVLVTAETTDDIEEVLGLGINDYLRKPFNVIEMKKLIEKFSE